MEKASLGFRELFEGIDLQDEDGNHVGESKKVARRAIAQVTISRILMASPTFVAIPIVMNSVVKTEWYKKRPWISAPFQAGLAGIVLAFSTPLCCALFPQLSSIKVGRLEPELQEKIRKMKNSPEVVYYNKGL
ncbi:hypothetical protein AB6A40_011227 [Gnathostoma spinigerum]|uniref:Sideroflexin 1 n=1 Tax=Gnathostoma spinigerum TaxID=75299 RepID=A0ABD6EX34_9BILA